MSPGSVLAWMPVAREVYELGQLIADRIRKRRARRRKAAQKKK